MKAQNSAPKPPSSSHRAARPRSPASARARAVRSLGRSRWNSPGSGASGAGVLPNAGRSAATASRIQDRHQLARGVFAGELEEDVLEPRRAGLGMRAQLVHRAAGADPSALNDPDAIA